MPKMESKKLYLDSMFLRLLSALVLIDQPNLHIPGNLFDRAMEKLFHDIVQKAGKENVMFRIQTHPIHGDSSDVRDELNGFYKMGLISFGCQDEKLHIHIPKEEAEKNLAEIPEIPKTDYSTWIADQFMQRYIEVS